MISYESGLPAGHRGIMREYRNPGNFRMRGRFYLVIGQAQIQGGKDAGL